MLNTNFLFPWQVVLEDMLEDTVCWNSPFFIVNFFPPYPYQHQIQTRTFHILP